MTGILNLRLTAAIQFHETLNGFCTSRGTGIASLEAKLLKQLMNMREEVLYEIFLGIHKTYGNLDPDLYLNTLMVYAVGPWSLRLLSRVRTH